MWFLFETSLIQDSLESPQLLLLSLCFFSSLSSSFLLWGMAPSPETLQAGGERVGGVWGLPWAPREAPSGRASDVGPSRSERQAAVWLMTEKPRYSSLPHDGSVFCQRRRLLCLWMCYSSSFSTKLISNIDWWGTQEPVYIKINIAWNRHNSKLGTRQKRNAVKWGGKKGRIRLCEM